MRRLLTFACDGAELGATLDGPADAETGLLMVTGGSQTRIGSHRMYEQLAKLLGNRGIASLRFDRRGVGDSGGDDRGFRGSARDLAAAGQALRRECAGVKRILGFGLCDGATALALFGDQAGLDGLILVNPWLVEAEAGEPPAAAIRHHYRERLLSLDGWKKLLTGAVDYRKLLRGIGRMAAGRGDTSLAGEVAAALARHRLPAALLLASGDATAIAAEQEVKSSAFKGLIAVSKRVETDSHTFARPGDDRLLLDAVGELVARLGDGG